MSYRDLLQQHTWASVRGALTQWALPLSARGWQHYVTGDSLPSALVGVVFDAVFDLSLEVQAAELQRECAAWPIASSQQSGHRHKVTAPPAFVAERFAELLQTRRRAFGRSPAKLIARQLPSWWPDAVTIDPTRVWRWEQGRSIPNVLFLVLIRDLYGIELHVLRDALLADLTAYRDRCRPLAA